MTDQVDDPIKPRWVTNRSLFAIRTHVNTVSLTNTKLMNEYNGVTCVITVVVHVRAHRHAGTYIDSRVYIISVKSLVVRLLEQSGFARVHKHAA